jgi:hypothetical protein
MTPAASIPVSVADARALWAAASALRNASSSHRCGHLAPPILKLAERAAEAVKAAGLVEVADE